MNEREKNNEITVGFLLAVLRHRLVWLIIILLVGALLAFGYTEFLVTPMYSSTADFKVENTYNSPSMMGSSYQQGATNLATSYAREMKGNVFLEKIVQSYNAKYGRSMTISELSSMLSVTAEAESPVFRVKITSADPQEAYDVLQIFQSESKNLLISEHTKDYTDIKLISSGRVSSSPDSPNLIMNVLVGAVGAFALAYVVFFVVAFLDKTVYDEETLKNMCHTPVVGQIPQWAHGDEDKKSRPADIDNKNGHPSHINRNYTDRLLNDTTPFSVRESFKTLRTNLTYVAVKSQQCPVFGITSAFAGAGKSLVIANLAISFAQLGKKVLLIDGDMRCPAQHKIFNVSASHHGLSEALAGIEENPLDTCVVKGAYETLDVMTSGHIPPNPSELLASDGMKALLEKAKEQYHYVFIDLPPILETADAGVIVPLVSAYVVVVRAGYSKIDAVVEVIETMQGMNATLAGCVLNDVNTKGGFGYYSQYSRYGRYGRYGRYAKYHKAAAQQELLESAEAEQETK